MVNHPDNPVLGGEGKDKGRVFSVYSYMYVIDNAHLRDSGYVYIMDEEDSRMMRRITLDDDVTGLGEVDPYNH